MVNNPANLGTTDPNLATEPTSSRGRAARISRRDYFRQRSPLEKWKLRLTILAVLVTGGWVLGGFLRPDGGVMRYSHGEICSAHAAWESNCEACHEPYHPINENTWMISLFGDGSSEGMATNARCEACHAGPAHHQSILPSAVQTCGSCHRDHQGRDHSLVDLPDHDCTRCHANLDTYHVDGQSAYLNVTDFGEPDGHPEFRLLDSSRGGWNPEQMRSLKFSHALHLTPGMVYTAGARRPWTLRDIPESSRERYRLPNQTDGEPVQLNCASCHQLDAGDVTIPDSQQLAGLPTAPLFPPRAEGKYFLPITYENQCKACHPLDGFDVEQPDLAVPHRLQPPEIDDYLQRLYADRLLAANPRLLDQPRSLPNDRLDGVSPTLAEEITLKNQIKDKVHTAKVLLYRGGRTCQKCHDVTRESESDLFPQAVKPARIPTIWFEHARFDHSAHRAMDCRACHEGAYDSVPANDRLIEKEPLKLPGIDNCRQCHAPPSEESLNGKMPMTFRAGGVAHNCTECHRYHNGDHPLQGPGAAAWKPTDLTQGQQLLGGNR